MTVIFGAATDPGRVRSENQDSYGIIEAANLFFVCDGMGGAAAGDFASRRAVEVIINAYTSITDDETALILNREFPRAEDRPAACVMLANRHLHKLTQKHPLLQGMGTTFAGIALDTVSGRIHVYHVGDSRVYRLRPASFDLLTKDHSKINELIDAGKMSALEARSAEIQSMITRALGTGQTVLVDHGTGDLLSGDVFILVTDGVNGELNDAQIRRIAQDFGREPGPLAEKLIQAANDRAGRDNSTVIVVRYDAGVTQQERRGTPRPFSVETLSDDLPRQISAQDRILGRLTNRFQSAVPAVARAKSAFSSLLVPAVLITLLLVGLAFVGVRFSRPGSSETLVELAGKVTGISLEVRKPKAEQMRILNKASDVVERIQAYQDIMRDMAARTEPLEGAQITVEANQLIQFSGLSASAPLAVKLTRGSYHVRIVHAGYRLVQPDLTPLDALFVSVENSSAYQKLTVVMLPTD